jgi:two-component sensor histidine kinase
VLWWFTGFGNSQLHFEWVEEDVEEDVRIAADARRNPGFGSQVVKRLIASELRGKGDMKFSSKDLLCTIEIPSGQALLKNE